MSVENIIGTLAGVLTGTAALPQLIKLIREKDGTNLSVVMLVVLICGLSLFTYYGILKEDWPIILTNGFSATVNIIILILRQVYCRR